MGEEDGDFGQRFSLAERKPSRFAWERAASLVKSGRRRRFSRVKQGSHPIFAVPKSPEPLLDGAPGPCNPSGRSITMAHPADSVHNCTPNIHATVQDWTERLARRRASEQRATEMQASAFRCYPTTTTQIGTSMVPICDP